MSDTPFSRTEMLLGVAAMERLKAARVAVFGIGGVGGYVVEALARSGVGALDLFDDDAVAPSNLNRQIIATYETLGRAKVDVMAERVARISPDTRVIPHRLFYMPDTADGVDLSQYDYIVDAVDTVAAKLELAVRATALTGPSISARGAGHKLDPTKLTVSDIAKTSVCPLARVMRRELRKRGVRHLKVAWSAEAPIVPRGDIEPDPGAHPRRGVPGSAMFVPAAMGLVIASEVVRDLTQALGISQ